MPNTSTIPGSVSSVGTQNFIATAVAVLAGLAAGLIHLSLVAEEFDKGATGYGTAFVLTGAATLVGLIVGYVPVAALASLRTLARVGLIVLSIGSIIAYLVLGYFDTLGWITKAVEVVFVVAIAATIAAEDRSPS